MVSNQHDMQVAAALAGEVQPWLAQAGAHLRPEERQRLTDVVDFVAPYYDGREELTGAPLLAHALGAAGILAGMRMDADTLCAAVLHAAPLYVPDWVATVTARFGPGVVALVDGIARMEQIRQFSEIQELHKRAPEGEDQQQIETLRKMLLAMVEDIRVVLIKLAERTQTLRTLSRADAEMQQQVARETRGIFAPLANRLGVWQVKWELEDLSMRYLEPVLYKKVARLLDERRIDREHYIEDAIATLRGTLAQAGIEAEIAGRPKHIYSIINKMKRKGLDFGQLYDVRALRILVADIRDCYAALGLVHNLWQPIPGEFDDYIAQPKSNDYRSLHTAVIGPRGLAIEVQIRTHEMHQHSELGVAAHWRYKEGGTRDGQFDEKIAWLRQVLEWREDVAESGELLEQFRNSLFQDQVYVLTPQGKVIDLSNGATPVDFAYALHTDLGHRTRGAKVDGSIVPLSYTLKNGQRVEILTAKQGAPSRDWINPALGFLHSNRARAKVRHWFRMQNQDDSLQQGRVVLDKELARLGVSTLNHEQLAQKLRFARVDELLAALGRGDVTARQLAHAVQALSSPEPEVVPRTVALRPASAKSGAGSVLVEGVDNLLTRIARCCQPVPPDRIVAYVTHERGVMVHRRDCPAMLRLPEKRRARMLDAQWGSAPAQFSVEIDVEAYDRQGLLHEISDLFVRERVNVTRVDTQSRQGRARMRFTVELAGLAQLSRLLSQIQQIPDVLQARRHSG